MGRRDLVARFLARTGLGAALRRAGVWDGLLVLNYHRIGDGSASPFDRNVWTTTEDEFDAQIAFVTRHGDSTRSRRRSSPCAPVNLSGWIQSRPGTAQHASGLRRCDVSELANCVRLVDLHPPSASYPIRSLSGGL